MKEDGFDFAFFITMREAFKMKTMN